MKQAWALIRKTQSHIITLDETKEDNPVVRLGYFIIELSYPCLVTYRCAGPSVREKPDVALKLMPLNGHTNQKASYGSERVRCDAGAPPWSRPTPAMCGSILLGRDEQSPHSLPPSSWLVSKVMNRHNFKNF